ncbi:serine protease snake-like [Zophobas morio]|uniref:serine protease snake-like n=1 Tax=Zophobas morio TaxID=2755281 RepID=UPI0030839265
MAAVGYGETKIAWSCGGSLISHRFVLSAAHCAESIELGPALWLRLGDLTLTNTIKDANSEVFKISEVHIHPKYRISSYYHDIALFKTERQVHFMSHIKPACLQVPRNFSITNLEAIGWGRTGFLDEGSGHLLKADLSVVNHSTCAKRYADVARTRKLTESILDEFQICAGSSEGKDTCLGDSGGPLHYELYRIHTVDNHFVVAGITSFGKGCGGNNSVGVYTRVSAYVRWIENIVWKEDD